MTTAAAIVASLREAIASGAEPPGAALRQAELASRFGTSRIPVREALQRLQSEGLVVVASDRGAYVATLTRGELDEIFDLRVLLEADALRHAVPRHDDRSLRQLEAIQRELDVEREREPWRRLDRAFHDVLYAPSQRPRTLATIAALRSAVERFVVQRIGPEARRPGWNDEHARLIDAVRGRRAERAAQLLVRHLRETQRVAIRALDAVDP